MPSRRQSQGGGQGGAFIQGSGVGSSQRGAVGGSQQGLRHSSRGGGLHRGLSVGVGVTEGSHVYQVQWPKAHAVSVTPGMGVSCQVALPVGLARQLGLAGSWGAAGQKLEGGDTAGTLQPYRLSSTGAGLGGSGVGALVTLKSGLGSGKSEAGTPEGSMWSTQQQVSHTELQPCVML